MRKTLSLLFLAALTWACASAPPEPERGVPRLLSDTLRFRKLGPEFACESSSEFLRALDFAAIQGCLASAKSPAKLSFLLDPESEKPALVLEKEPAYFTGGLHGRKRAVQSKRVPFCVAELLARIPVPREIFFEAEDLECYASGITTRKKELRIDVALPIMSILRTPEDARSLVLSWVMTPFWDEERGWIPVKPLTDSLCRACLGEGHRIRSLKPPRATWPAAGD